MAFAILWPICADAAFVRPSGATDAFGYDGLGNWTTYTNAEGRVYRMAYDALGRLVAATNAANEQVFANRYDPVGSAPSEARRFLRGGSPRRVRISHPLVPSVGTMEEESNPNEVV